MTTTDRYQVLRPDGSDGRTVLLTRSADQPPHLHHPETGECLRRRWDCTPVPEPAPLAQVHRVSSWREAGVIRDAGVHLVLLPQAPPAWVVHALDTLADEALPTLRAEGPPAQALEALLTDCRRWDAGPLGTWLAEDLERHLAAWRELVKPTRCRLQVECPGDDACRKFHTDQVGIRLLCTYRGPGTEWVPDEAVRRSRLGAHGENDDIVPDPLRIQRLERFTIGLLKGDRWPCRTPGIIHRSPPLPGGQPRRVLLRADG